MTSAAQHLDNLINLEEDYVNMTQDVINESRQLESRYKRLLKLRELLPLMKGLPAGSREALEVMIYNAKYDIPGLKWTIRLLIAVKIKLIHSYFAKELRGAYLSPELLEFAENFEYVPEPVGVWARLNFHDVMKKRRQDRNIKELIEIRRDYFPDFKKVFNKEKQFRFKLNAIVEMRNSIVGVGCPSLDENLDEADMKLREVLDSLNQLMEKKRSLQDEADDQLNDYITDSVEPGELTQEMKELVDRPFEPATIIDDDNQKPLAESQKRSEAQKPSEARQVNCVKDLRELVKYETTTNERCDYLRSLIRRDRELMDAEKKSRNNRFGPENEYDLIVSYTELIDERWKDVRHLMSSITERRRAFAVEYFDKEMQDDFTRNSNLRAVLQQFEDEAREDKMDIDDKEVLTGNRDYSSDDSMGDESEHSEREYSTATESDEERDDEKDDCSGKEDESDMSEYDSDCAMETD